MVTVGWLLLWFTILIVSSFLLSMGAEGLSHRFGGKFVGRTLLSITTTLPEIFIVASASYRGHHATSLGSALGSNVLMMSLGLAIMVIIATTRLSHKPIREIKVEGFKLDMIFLIGSAVLGAILFIDGYDILDRYIFLGLFISYLALAFYESRREKKTVTTTVGKRYSPWKGAVLFGAGALGIFIVAEPFILSLEELAVGTGVSAAVIAVLLSPIAGEMPEKLSMMMLARKGERGVSISIANVLGSKVLNNTLLLAIMVFAASFTTPVINPTGLLTFEVYWATVITLLALFLMFDRRLTRRDGFILVALYVTTIILQFVILRFP